MSQQFGFERLVETSSSTHDKARQAATPAIDRWLVVRNWLFGLYIVEYEQKGGDRAAYGRQALSKLSAALKRRIGRGVSVDALEKMRRFCLAHQYILSNVSATGNSATLSRISGDRSISATLSRISAGLSSRRPIRVAELAEQFSLGWSHYVTLLSVANSDAREGQVVGNASALIKNPVVPEFLELEEEPAYSESDLEAAIIDRLQGFLLELGKSFLFEACQKRFSFDDRHVFVDLVFYNRFLRSYDLIDLKRGGATHHDSDRCEYT